MFAHVKMLAANTVHVIEAIMDGAVCAFLGNRGSLGDIYTFPARLDPRNSLHTVLTFLPSKSIMVYGHEIFWCENVKIHSTHNLL